MRLRKNFKILICFNIRFLPKLSLFVVNSSTAVEHEVNSAILMKGHKLNVTNSKKDYALLKVS